MKSNNIIFFFIIGFNLFGSSLAYGATTLTLTPITGPLGTNVQAVGKGYTAGGDTITHQGASGAPHSYTNGTLYFNPATYGSFGGQTLTELDFPITGGSGKLYAWIYYETPAGGANHEFLLGGGSVVAGGSWANVTFNIPVPPNFPFSTYYAWETDSIGGLSINGQAGNDQCAGNVNPPSPPSFWVFSGTCAGVADAYLHHHSSTVNINATIDNAKLPITQPTFTNTTGGFITNFIVPNVGTGAHVINMTDNASPQKFATAIFTVNGTLVLNPPQGPSYTNVLVSGNGYHKTSNLNFTLDGNFIAGTNQTNPATVPKTDSTGKFSNILINIPAVGPGQHTVKACDSSNRCLSAIFTLTKAGITNYAAGSQNGNTTTINPIIVTDTPQLVISQSLYRNDGLLLQTINYPSPISINSLFQQVPLPAFTFNLTSSITMYEIVSSTDGFSSYNTKSQSLFFTPVLSSSHPTGQPGTPNSTFTPGTNNTNPGNQIIPNNQNFNPVNITPGQQNFSATNTNQIPITYTRIDHSASVTYLLVGYPNSFNLTCNLSYQFAMINQTYIKLPHTTIPNNRFQANFTFTNPNNEVITTNCTDVNTHVSANYVLVQSNFPLQQQTKQFRSGQFGTHGQFGVIDVISLIGILTAMIGLSRVNEAAGIIIAVIMLAILSFFQFVTWQTTVTGFIAVVVMIAVVSTKKLPWSQ